MSRRPILVFTHIPRTAGMTLISVLRSVYGIGHCRATQFHRPAPDELRVYTGADLRLDMRFYPWLRAISGHAVKPFLDYGEVEPRLTWITMLRDPVDRFLSHYRYYCNRRRISPTFEEWCAERGERAANLQVRWLAGTVDLAAAKEVLARRFACVGDQADFDTSLATFAACLGEPRFPTSVGWTINATASGSDALDRDLAAGFNQLDIELYEHFRSQIWPRQLARHDRTGDRPYVDSVGNRLRRTASLAYHGAVYKNVRRLSALRHSLAPRLSERP